MHEEKDKKNQINHKRALELNAYAVGAGAFGVFFRWMQRQLAFENGLAKSSFWNLIVPLSILVVGYVFLRFEDRFKISAAFCRMNLKRPWPARESSIPLPAGLSAY